MAWGDFRNKVLVEVASLLDIALLFLKHGVFNGKFDALIGMAYPEFAEPGVQPLFDGLMESKKLDANVFSWYLSYNPDEQSEILFGGQS